MMKSFLIKRLNSIRYALNGLSFVLKSQQNAWIHLAATGGVICAGIVVDLSRADWLWVASAIALVWFAEVMNTGFEYLCDVVSPEFNTAVEKAKDIAAGAVLITAVYAVIVGILTFGPYFF